MIAIYILTVCEDSCCYCDEIVGVYSTVERAQEGALHIKRYKYFMITESELDDPTFLGRTWTKQFDADWYES